MAVATGIPAFVWAVIWIGIAVGILAMAMRLYVVGRKKQFQLDQPFEPLPMPLFPTTIHDGQNLR
jgi:tellurite resistance protein TehA-like permease